MITGRLDYSVPLVGRNFSQLAGVVLFNFAYTVTVPSWLCEKKVRHHIDFLGSSRYYYYYFYYYYKLGA